MSRTHSVVSGALLVGAVAAFTACRADNNSIVVPTPADPLFSSYVALGNSITAGYQSGGINDSTQRQSYAVLLANQMHTRFAYPSLVNPGCPPPINNTLTGTRVGGASSTGTTCLLRSPASVSALINNVAVPGISTIDPTAVGGTPGAQGPSNPLVELFLGGETMVQKALDNRPTFATIWVGNNDVLSYALSGFPAGATPLATFQTNYDKMITQMMAGAPGLKGVLIGVVDVTQAPLMINATTFNSPTVIAASTQIAGRPVFLDPNTCTAAAQPATYVNFQAIAAIRSRPAAVPGAIFCQKVAGGGANDPGDNGVLDPTETATTKALVASYNAYIKSKADAIGFAYYDPNTTLATLKADPTKIPPFPNVAATTTSPFGQYISYDGVHPAAAAHVLIANDIIAVINAKYGTHLAPTS
jgi:lysophospholipase L1-like esterase